MKKKTLVWTVTVMMFTIICSGYEEELKLLTASSINHLAFDILTDLTEDNIFFSPYSISNAMSLTSLGASGVTKQEMAQVLHHLTPKEELKKTFSKIQNETADKGLFKESELIHQGYRLLNNFLQQQQQSEGLTFTTANALWADQKITINSGYLELANLFYEAGISEVDFASQPEESRQIINRWVERQTNDKIKNLLEHSSITPLTKMVLTNAIYFLGEWTYEFDPENTETGTFYAAEEHDMSFMKMTKQLALYQENSFQAINIPYKGGSLGMTIILPHKEQPDFIREIDYALYHRIINGKTHQRVELHLPKFEMEEKYELKGLLSRLGMTKAFDSDADFTAMIDDDIDFFIDEVIHQAYIEVDEKGTEAAAATGVVMRTTSIEPDPIVVRVDRPFLFFIKDNETNLILFCGKFSSPQ